MPYWVLSNNDAGDIFYVYHLHPTVTLYVKTLRDAQTYETEADAQDALSQIPLEGFYVTECVG